MKYRCHCGRIFSHRQGLSIHKKSCIPATIPEQPEVNSEASANKIIVPTKRKNTSKKLRTQVYEKQNGKCGKCDNILSEYYQIDHIIGLQFGGSNEEKNLMALCCECHAEKSSK